MNQLPLFLTCLSTGRFPKDVIPYDFIKSCEELLIQKEQSDAPLEHKILPSINGYNIYVRTIKMKKGQVIVSKLHKTKHPFVITEGVVTVYSTTNGLELLRAPYHGVTKPGTKRLLYINEDTVWTTYHITDKNNHIDAENDIIEQDESKINLLLCLSQ